AAGLTPLMATSQPWAANALATPRPMPRRPPVMSATLRFSGMLFSLVGGPPPPQPSSVKGEGVGLELSLRSLPPRGGGTGRGRPSAGQLRHLDPALLLPALEGQL